MAEFSGRATFAFVLTETNSWVWVASAWSKPRTLAKKAYTIDKTKRTEATHSAS